MTPHPSDGPAHRVDAFLAPDPARTIAQLYLPGPDRARSVCERVQALSDAEVSDALARVLDGFADRHRDLPALLRSHADAALALISAGAPLTDDRALLLGASLTAEYAVEAAALCNPSAVEHPDQSGLQAGQLRVALSLRCIGEGHRSTIGFCTALIGPGRRWTFDQRALPLVPAAAGHDDDAATPTFPPDIALAQQLLVPATPEESNGIEDARFTRFTADDGTVEYRATYTAYDGHDIAPKLLTSPDLKTFRAHALAGPAAQNKGMALFPRRIGGKYVALCRTDGESNSVASSADGLLWDEPLPVQQPALAWETLQIGNCGPPIETAAGWLVLTHGVGPMRTYAIGAILLDLHDPGRLIGRLDQPLLFPGPDEQEGYVPNVLYSCGAVVKDGELWVPYGIGDSRIGVAWAEIDDILAAMTPTGGR